MALSKYNRTYEAFFSTKANEITGKINSKYTNLNDYFKLKQINAQLAIENNALREKLKTNFEAPDSSIKNFTDTLIKDTSNHYRKYTYLPAKVVINSTSQQYNFIQLERGALQGVAKDMGVVGPLGIVGKVVSVSNNFCMVMSLINRSSKVSAMFKRGNEQYATNVSWDGKNPAILTMEGVSKSVDVKKGDTIVTSNYSPSFPSMLMIGTVIGYKLDVVGNNYTVTIKPTTNFNTLQYVNIIKNAYYEEQHTLDSATIKNHLKALGE